MLGKCVGLVCRRQAVWFRIDSATRICGTALAAEDGGRRAPQTFALWQMGLGKGVGLCADVCGKQANGC